MKNLIILLIGILLTFTLSNCVLPDMMYDPSEHEREGNDDGYKHRRREKRDDNRYEHRRRERDDNRYEHRKERDDEHRREKKDNRLPSRYP